MACGLVRRRVGEWCTSALRWSFAVLSGMRLKYNPALDGLRAVAIVLVFLSHDDWAASAPDELIVCRCENISAGDIRSTAAANVGGDINRIKALCRVGMGRCQGRMCGVAATEILANALQVPVASIGRIRGQAPIKPLPLDMTVTAHAKEAAHG